MAVPPRQNRRRKLRAAGRDPLARSKKSQTNYDYEEKKLGKKPNYDWNRIRDSIHVRIILNY